MGGRTVLEVNGLTVAYRGQEEWLDAVRDFSLRIGEGETYGLVGESGSGKTTVALAVMRYLGQQGRIVSGSILFDSVDMLAMSQEQLRRMWGKEVALVPQDPQSSLNPSMRVGEQIAEVLRRHLSLSPQAADERAIELLDMVRIPDPRRVANSYPHQISGGMQQRTLIAMALSTEPNLLILDEPTTGLDVTTQAAILELVGELTRQRKTAVLYVTHNLAVVASICDRVAVLYAGELVEDAAVDELFARPLHPYTEGLLASVPKLGETKSQVVLQAIPGQIPPLGERASACVFEPRCPLAIEQCVMERPPLYEAPSGRLSRCHRWSELDAGEISAQFIDAPPEAETSSAMTAGEQAIGLEQVEVHFETRRTLLESLRRRPHDVVKAVDGVDLSLDRARTLGIVGESGSGKTTLARAIVGLTGRTAGDILLLGVSLPVHLAERTKETLAHLQFVFQNPTEALNPHMTVLETLRRPFVSISGLSKEGATERANELLQLVRLPISYGDRYPGQLSGGEKQRVAIARAFATNPDLLIADEPVSSLDVSVQASVLNLLNDLQRENKNGLILISHDLAVVGYLADQIAVMYLGRIMEFAGAELLFEYPMHPYTEALIDAIPTLDPQRLERCTPLEGDVPSQIEAPSGCPFHPRCPRYLGDVCRSEVPPWRESRDGDRILCHIPLDELKTIQMQKDIASRKTIASAGGGHRE